MSRTRLYPNECSNIACHGWGYAHSEPCVTDSDMLDEEQVITERDIEVTVSDRDRAYMMHVLYGAAYDACWDCDAE